MNTELWSVKAEVGLNKGGLEPRRVEARMGWSHENGSEVKLQLWNVEARVGWSQGGL